LDSNTKEFKCLLLKLTNDFKDDLNKHEIKKSLPDLDEKHNNLDEKFSKETDSAKTILGMKSSINQIKIS
jgi:hypothetical protein